MQLVFILLLYLSTLLSLLISLTGFSMCKIISPESRVKLSPFFSNLNAQHLFLLPIVWARNLKHLLLSRCGEGKHPCLFLMAKAEPSPHPWCECSCWSLSYWLYQIGIRFFLLLVSECEELCLHIGLYILNKHGRLAYAEMMQVSVFSHLFAFARGFLSRYDLTFFLWHLLVSIWRLLWSCRASLVGIHPIAFAYWPSLCLEWQLWHIDCPHCQSSIPAVWMCHPALFGHVESPG